MISNNINSTRRISTLTYVAESERDAERLRSQVDAPVWVRGRHREGLGAATTEETGVPAPETPEASEVFAATRRSAL